MNPSSLICHSVTEIARAAAIAIVVAAVVTAPARANERRVVSLAGTENTANNRIEIRNPSSETITFTLGFNDQLFENRESLIAAVRSSAEKRCEGFDDRQVDLPCAAFQRVSNAITHFSELTDQFDANGIALAPRLWFESPTLAINSFGIGTCGTFTDVLGKIWKALGYETRRRTLDGHVVSEVRVEGQWLLFDADMRGFFVDGGKILGLDHLVDDPSLAVDGGVARVLSGDRECDFPHAGLVYYADLLVASPKPPGIEEVPEGDFDWHELTVSLPPGSRFLFPETPRSSSCMFPEYSELTDTGSYGDLRNPPYQYAVMEIPAGTVTDIRNGLFPLLVKGDYRLAAVYSYDSERTSNFNQVDRFRFARQFAREFRALEARSAVSIYYMLTSRVAVGDTNEVRIEGERVGDLQVSLNEVPPTIAERSPPCLSSTQSERVRVRKASASSNSYGDVSLQEQLIDGSLLNGWASDLTPAPTPQVITLDLGRPKVVGGIRWAPHVSYGMLSPTSINVETSVFGRSYRAAVEVSDYSPSRVDWMEHQFRPRLARFVRLTMTPAEHFLVPGYFQALLSEIEVLRPGPGTPN